VVNGRSHGLISIPGCGCDQEIFRAVGGLERAILSDAVLSCFQFKAV
jgi:hypothetical protein